MHDGEPWVLIRELQAYLKRQGCQKPQEADVWIIDSTYKHISKEIDQIRDGEEVEKPIPWTLLEDVRVYLLCMGCKDPKQAALHCVRLVYDDLLLELISKEGKDNAAQPAH